MRSVRLDPELDARVQRAARVEQSSVSAFIRRALDERAEHVLSGEQSTAEKLADVIGIVHGGGGQADRTGAAFLDELLRRHREQ